MLFLENWVIILSLLLGSAHFLRQGELNGTFIYLSLVFLYFSKIRISRLLVNIALICLFFTWLKISYGLILFRINLGLPWYRLLFIMLGVLLLTLLAIYFSSKAWEQFNKKIFSFGLFILVVLIFLWLRYKLSFSILLLDRFANLGLWQAFMLGLYAAYLGDEFLEPKKQYYLRPKIWLLFSLVFFGQLLLGLFVDKRFLLTGKLHFPIPALIIGGPVYRGQGFFMLGLFISTLLLVGSAWCSHLCYVGGLDNFFASRKKVKKRPLLSRKLAWFNLGLVLLLAASWPRQENLFPLLLGLVSFFGVVSLGFIVVYSWKKGAMTHCVGFCPLGLISVFLGKINPFRVRVKQGKCTGCGVCVKKCFYQAIDKVENKVKINNYCTLCLACLASCPHEAITFTLGGKYRQKVYKAYIFLIVSLHTLFLGLARI